MKLQIIATLENIFTLGAFTLLAYHFDKWWIVFFSLIFFSSVKTIIKE